MKNRILACISLLMLVCSIAAPAAGAQGMNKNVLDDNIYYGEAAFYQMSGGEYLPLTTIVAGEILCQYSVIDAAPADELSMVAGLYHNQALVSVQALTKQLTENQNAVYTATVQVPSAQGYEIRLFLMRGLAVHAPVRSVAKLSEKSAEKDVLSFVLGDAEGRIDNRSNEILVKVPADMVLTDLTPRVTVSSGAGYRLSGNDFSETVFLTVTAVDGTSRDYAVRTEYQSKEYFYDFTDYVLNQSPDVTDPRWVPRQSTGVTVTVVQEDGNNVLDLMDTSTADRAASALRNLGLAVPFEVSCRIKYRLPGGGQEHDTVNDLSYCTFWLGETTQLGGFEPVYNSDAYYFCYYNNGNRVRSSVKLDLYKWYDVTMTYYQGADGNYYADYTVADDDGNRNTFAEIPSGKTDDALTDVTMWTSPGRYADILLDNIYMRELSEDGCEKYTQDFESGANDWVGGSVAEGTLTVSNGRSAYTDTEAFIGSTKYTFDMQMADASGAGEIFSFGTGGTAAGKLIYDGGKLRYELDGQNLDLWDFPIVQGKTYQVEVDYIQDAAYGNSRIDFYLNGVRIGNSLPLYQADSLSRVTFTAPSAGTLYIDNVCIEKC